ncbi:FeoA family protein [Sphingomonas jaspsi]|jgi:ferrous iron transport protein A|uniref:FeoA family protein n=1 Tax=Sphingomonas jaspsi TaxID=392409 RepID=UPI0004BC281A|nr:FeoA family protein [Sphingomonas jaspsi]
MSEPLITLDKLRRGIRARVESVDWAILEEADRIRLRQFGFDEGVTVEQMHQGPFGADPVAIKVGRMTVAIRRSHARAIKVSTAA